MIRLKQYHWEIPGYAWDYIDEDTALGAARALAWIDAHYADYLAQQHEAIPIQRLPVSQALN